MKWNILICEDDPQQCRCLEDMLAQDARFQLACCPSAEALRRRVSSFGRPDILLIDIRLGAENGIELVKQLLPEGAGTEVIHVTGYVEYCTKVYETEHVSFLLKPVKTAELLQAVEQAINRLNRRWREGVAFPVRNSVYFLPYASIRYLESRGRKLRLVTDENEYEAYLRFQDICPRLDGRFLQCHKSFVVNLDRVVELEPHCFHLSTGERIPISVRRQVKARETFLRALGVSMRSTPR